MADVGLCLNRDARNPRVSRVRSHVPTWNGHIVWMCLVYLPFLDKAIASQLVSDWGWF